MRIAMIGLGKMGANMTQRLIDHGHEVVDPGEGRWTVEEAIDRGVSAPVISSALFARFASQKPDAFGLRLVSALRNQVGGHAYTTAGGAPAGETATPR